jgi:hypothetical protein
MGLALIFLLLNHNRLKLRQYFYYFLGFLIIVFPLFIYITQPGSNYFQREGEVTILTRPKYFQERWKTDSMAIVLYQQIKTNFLGFINVEDFSNQYGNGPLLDRVSMVLFLFSILLLPILLFKRKGSHRRSILFLSLAFITSLVAVSFTESPPLSTRLLILYPIISIFLALTLNYGHLLVGGLVSS